MGQEKQRCLQRLGDGGNCDTLFATPIAPDPPLSAALGDGEETPGDEAVPGTAVLTHLKQGNFKSRRRAPESRPQEMDPIRYIN